MFQLAYLLAAPIIGSNLSKIGRKNSIVFGYVLLVVSTACFGVLAYVHDRYLAHFLNNFQQNLLRSCHCYQVLLGSR